MLTRMTHVRRLGGLSLCLCLSVATPAVAQQDWLPPAVRQGLATQLAERVTTVVGGGKPAREPDRLARFATDVVQAMRARVDAWSTRGVLERAPVFAKLGLPAAREPHLDAMARYQLCNMPLMLQFEAVGDERSRMTGALGLTAMTVAIVHLRQPYLAGGGSPEDIPAFLTSAAMERVAQSVQTTPELRAHVERQCEPVVADLVQAIDKVTPR
jgi:hypothetical protein